MSYTNWHTEDVYNQDVAPRDEDDDGVTDNGDGWDGDRCVGYDGHYHDADDADFEWKTGHTACGDDDSD
jgi:hypothetical protein